MVSSDGVRLIRRSGNRLADQITRQVNEPSQRTRSTNQRTIERETGAHFR
jgi:hypothetical protein